MSVPLLRLEGVSAAYGRLPALFGIDLAVGGAEIVALLGPNGAGKTTTLRAISGVVRARGVMRFDGAPIEGRRPEDIARLGIAHVPEGRGLFPSLTVSENLRVGSFVAPAGTDVAAETDRVLTMFPVLRERARQPAGTLSGGEQQMLAIARALISKPRLLLIDELSLGLAPAVVERLFAILPRIAADGTAVLLVEQFVGHALALADRAVVLERGRVTWSGPAVTLARRRGFVDSSYLGRGGLRPSDGSLSVASERVQVAVPVRELRALQRVAATTGRSVEELLAERLAANGSRR